MGSADQLHAALGDGARGLGLEAGADLVDDDHLGGVVLDGLDHDLVLELGSLNLHAARTPDGSMGNVAIAADLVGGVDNHDPLVELVGEDPCRLAQHRGLADARRTQQEDTASLLEEVAREAGRALHTAPDAEREPHDAPSAVADRGDAVQCARDARAVVFAEGRDLGDDLLDLLVLHAFRGQHDLAGGVAGRGDAPEVEDYLEEPIETVTAHRFGDARRQPLDEQLDLGQCCRVGVRPLSSGGRAARVVRVVNHW